MPVTLTSISPSSGSPGTAITCTGTGFDAGAQVGCPTLVPTTFVNSTTLMATIPAGLAGPQGSSMQVAVFVLGSDQSTSAVLMFTAQFIDTTLQAWTSVDAVASEVPGFKRGGQISDNTIQTWIRSIAQEIAAEMMRRGLSLDPTTWQLPQTAGQPDPSDVAEMINRMGAAARLAAAVSAQFSGGAGEWSVSKNLTAAYLRQLTALRNGDYDKFFNPSAATVDAAPQLAASTASHPLFRTEKVF
jgi:hypothetical protein